MMRKLVEQGGTTLMVSLPSKWLKQFNLKKGDEVEVEDSGSSVVVSVTKQNSVQECTVDISGKDVMIKRILGAIYKIGYDQINIRFDTAEELKTAQEVINQEYVGFEVIEQSNKSIVARRISSIEYSEFDTTLRRLFMFMLSTGDDLVSALKNNNREDINMIIPRDITINKLCVFCRRSLNKRGYKDGRRTNVIYYIVEELEKIGDAYRDFCKEISENSIKPKKELISAVAAVNRFLREFYEMYYSFSLEKVAVFGKSSKDLEDTLSKLYEDAEKKEYKAVFQLQLIRSLCFDMNGALIAANI